MLSTTKPTVVTGIIPVARRQTLTISDVSEGEDDVCAEVGVNVLW
jgi:hypothetical protein